MAPPPCAVVNLAPYLSVRYSKSAGEENVGQSRSAAERCHLGAAPTRCGESAGPRWDGRKWVWLWLFVLDPIDGLPWRCKGVFALWIQDRTADDISGLWLPPSRRALMTIRSQEPRD